MTVFVLAVFMAGPAVYSAKSKKLPVIIVQAVARDVDSSGIFEDLYLILPDGSHAIAQCDNLKRECGVESWAPEKRKETKCHSEAVPYAWCFAPEAFRASRRNNDLWIGGPNGVFHYTVTGSWDGFDPGFAP
ncbi:MAG: hypothetical protein WCA44_12070 [Acidobacteriaceae bacterium]